VEAAFRAYAQGKAQMPPKPYLNFETGDLRIMPAYLPELGLAGVKLVNVHPDNVELPTVMGTLAVFDPGTGFLLAIMDATYLTAVRTGAAGAIAAKYLARTDSTVASFVGAGIQAYTQLQGLLVTVPSIERLLVCDVDADAAQALAHKAHEEHGLAAEACSLDDAVRNADILTTTTPVRKPIVKGDLLRPGTHVNAIGADAPGKQELERVILESAKQGRATSASPSASAVQGLPRAMPITAIAARASQVPGWTSSLERGHGPRCDGRRRSDECE